MANDASRYVEFFKASLAFCDSYAELQTIWRDQHENRQRLGVSPSQEREMAMACAARRHEVEALDDVITEVIPRRPGRA